MKPEETHLLPFFLDYNNYNMHSDRYMNRDSIVNRYMYKSGILIVSHVCSCAYELCAFVCVSRYNCISCLATPSQVLRSKSTRTRLNTTFMTDYYLK